MKNPGMPPGGPSVDSRARERTGRSGWVATAQITPTKQRSRCFATGIGELRIGPTVPCRWTGERGGVAPAVFGRPAF